MEKKDRKWQPAAGCAVGVSVPVGNSHFPAIWDIFPEIPIETVLGTAILLMGVGAGWTWMEEKNEEKIRNSLQNGETKYRGNLPE